MVPSLGLLTGSIKKHGAAACSLLCALLPLSACPTAEYDEDGDPDVSTIKPMVDGGTEGFKGHARVILPGFTPCFECTLWLFPPQTKFPLCTLSETPRYGARAGLVGLERGRTHVQRGHEDMRSSRSPNQQRCLPAVQPLTAGLLCGKRLTAH